MPGLDADARLSLYWATRITGTLAASSQPLALDDLSRSLGLSTAQAQSRLALAAQQGLIEVQSRAWTLTPAGASIGQLATEARGRAQAIEGPRTSRGFTDFLPTGREVLA